MDAVIDRIGQLLSQLQSTDFFERERAVRELGVLEQDEAVAGLVMALEDSDRGIRELSAELISSIKGETAVQLLIRFLGHEDLGTRNLAAEVIVRIGEDAVKPLIENITDPKHEIRKFIVDILGRIGSDQATDALCESLFDENTNVVCSSAEALGQIGACRAIPDLIAVFENIPDSHLNVVEALGKIGDPKALPKLYELLATSDSVLKALVIEAIGNIGDPNSIAKLTPLLDAEDATAAETALLAIIKAGQTNSSRTLAEIPLGRFQEFLFTAVGNGNNCVTDFVLDCLEQSPSSEFLESLLDVLPQLDEPYLSRAKGLLQKAGPLVSQMVLQQFLQVPSASQEMYLEVLRPLVNAGIVDRLIELVDSVEPEIKQRLAHVFGWSDLDQARSALRAMTGDGNGHVRGAAYAALGWHATGAEHIDVLFAGLDDVYGDVREAAMGALVMIGSTEVVERFTKDLYHSNTERQRLAVKALGAIGAWNVVAPLTQATNHPDSEMRRSAIDALGRIRSVEDTQPLVLALGDENSSVRKAAVSALIAIRGENAIDDIRYLLDDEDVWVRFHTISAIGEVGSSADSQLLLRLLNDKEEIIRIVTAQALAKIGGPEALSELERLCDDRNPDLVEAAETAISAIRREYRS